MSRDSLLHPISEHYFFSALITLAGGFLDAYTYLTRGKVFATAQTGNIILMGLRLADGQLDMVAFYFVPVLAYSLGVLSAEFLRKYMGTRLKLHWMQAVLGVNCLLLLAVAFSPSGGPDPGVNVAVSFISAMQMQAFRSLCGNTYASTMCTGNLRSGSEALSAFLLKQDRDAGFRALQYYSIIVFFALGAFFSAVLTNYFSERSVLFCFLLYFLAIVMLSRQKVGQSQYFL